MRFALKDREKYSFFFLPGIVHLTFDQPGPKEVDVAALSDQERQQLVYNVRRGVIACDEFEKLVGPEEGSVAVTAKSYSTPQEVPVRKETIKNHEELIEERVKELKTLLKGSIPTVLSAMKDLRTNQMTALIKLEKEGKNRKKLLAALEKEYSKYCESVAKSVGNVDVTDSVKSMRADSTIVSDVVESEVEKVELIPGG